MVVRLRFNSKGKQVRAAAPPRAVPAQPLPSVSRLQVHARPEQVSPQELAQALATVLAPMAAAAVALALWRIGQDMGFAANFFISEGPLSHWQVWFALASTLLAVVVYLNRRSRNSDDEPLTS
jgi:hypothetical protein